MLRVSRPLSLSEWTFTAGLCPGSADYAVRILHVRRSCRSRQYLAYHAPYLILRQGNQQVPSIGLARGYPGRHLAISATFFLRANDQWRGRWSGSCELPQYRWLAQIWPFPTTSKQPGSSSGLLLRVGLKSCFYQNSSEQVPDAAHILSRMPIVSNRVSPNPCPEQAIQDATRGDVMFTLVV